MIGRLATITTKMEDPCQSLNKRTELKKRKEFSIEEDKMKPGESRIKETRKKVIEKQKQNSEVQVITCPNCYCFHKKK